MTDARIVVEIHHPSFGGIGTNTWALHWEGGFADTLGDVDDLASMIFDFYSGFNGDMPATAHFVWDGTVRGLGANEGDTATTTGFTASGVGGEAVLPAATALCVSWHTGSGGRSGRGRTFISPLSTSGLASDGGPTSGVLTDLRATAAELVASSVGHSTAHLGVYSTKDHLFRQFTGSTVTDQFAVLRSRRD